MISTLVGRSHNQQVPTDNPQAPAATRSLVADFTAQLATPTVPMSGKIIFAFPVNSNNNKIAVKGTRHTDANTPAIPTNAYACGGAT